MSGSTKVVMSGSTKVEVSAFIKVDACGGFNQLAPLGNGKHGVYGKRSIIGTC